MSSTVVVIAFTVVVVLLVLVSAVRVIKQYELGVLFRLRRLWQFDPASINHLLVLPEH